MATQLQLRKGTRVENDAFTGAEGEVTYETNRKLLRLHDGSRQGGYMIDPIVGFQEPTAANGYTWYRKYSSGWVEQGGQKNSGNAQVNFPVTMANANYQVQVTGGDDNYSINYIARNRTTTAVWVTARTAGGSDFDSWFGYWMVCGMAA